MGTAPEISVTEVLRDGNPESVNSVEGQLMIAVLQELRRLTRAPDVMRVGMVASDEVDDSDEYPDVALKKAMLRELRTTNTLLASIAERLSGSDSTGREASSSEKVASGRRNAVSRYSVRGNALNGR